MSLCRANNNEGIDPGDRHGVSSARRDSTSHFFNSIVEGSLCLAGRWEMSIWQSKGDVKKEQNTYLVNRPREKVIVL
jgi:hypothetical protein